MIKAGGNDGSGDTRILINDTQNYVFDNIIFDGNVTAERFCLNTDCTHYYNSTGVECWDDDGTCDRYIDGTGTNLIIQS